MRAFHPSRLLARLISVRNLRCKPPIPQRYGLAALSAFYLTEVALLVLRVRAGSLIDLCQNFLQNVRMGDGIAMLPNPPIMSLDASEAASRL